MGITDTMRDERTRRWTHRQRKRLRAHRRHVRRTLKIGCVLIWAAVLLCVLVWVGM